MARGLHQLLPPIEVVDGSWCNANPDTPREWEVTFNMLCMSSLAAWQNAQKADCGQHGIGNTYSHMITQQDDCDSILVAI